jgi:predicted transcriptional regulator
LAEVQQTSQENDEPLVRVQRSIIRQLALPAQTKFHSPIRIMSMTQHTSFALDEIVRLSVRFALILSRQGTPSASGRVEDRLRSFLDEIIAAEPKPHCDPRRVPAVPVERSILHHAIISLEDGQPYKTLYSHLSSLGLTPKAYRRKWGLPRDYPMAAPAERERLRALRECCGHLPCRRRGRRRRCQRDE